MNALSVHDRKRTLPVVLAALVLLQTLLGIPELTAGATGDGATDPHHASFFVDVDPVSDGAGEADDCGSPSETQCDHCCCCQGTHFSVLPDLMVLHDLPISNWLMPPWDRSPSRSSTAIHRPPIA
jgi:hypothetical protein